MTVSYDWEFGPAETADENGMTDVIKVVAWILVATDGLRTERSSDRLGLTSPTANNFTPFAQLTKGVLVSWVETNPALDLPALKVKLADRLNIPALPAAQITTTKELPFAEVI